MGKTTFMYLIPLGREVLPYNKDGDATPKSTKYLFCGRGLDMLLPSELPILKKCIVI